MEVRSRQRLHLLHRMVQFGELPMAVLGIVWMALLGIDMVQGLHGVLSRASQLIWILFAVDVVAELAIAPNKRTYVKRHWPIMLSLALPALRIVRIIRVVHLAQATRVAPFSHSLVALHRGLAALGATLRRRGFAYMLILTMVVTLLGAAVMVGVEKGAADPEGIHDHGSAVWWTAMLMTTLGPPSWPVTVAGRVFCFILALYAFTVFGYVTATLATFFIDRDADRPDTAVAGERSVEDLRTRVIELQRMIEERLPAR